MSMSFVTYPPNHEMPGNGRRYQSESSSFSGVATAGPPLSLATTFTDTYQPWSLKCPDAALPRPLDAPVIRTVLAIVMHPVRVGAADLNARLQTTGCQRCITQQCRNRPVLLPL